MTDRLVKKHGKNNVIKKWNIKPDEFKKDLGERPEVFTSECDVVMKTRDGRGGAFSYMSNYDHGYLSDGTLLPRHYLGMMHRCREFHWRKYGQKRVGTPLCDLGYKGYGKIFEVIPNTPGELRRMFTEKEKNSWWSKK